MQASVQTFTQTGHGQASRDAPPQAVFVIDAQEDLLKAIWETLKGWSHLDPQVAGKLLKHVAHQPARVMPDRTLISQLSDRECEVLRLLATGLSNAAIAQTRFLSDGTVKNYVSLIFSKLGVADRTQAAILAIRAGMV